MPQTGKRDDPILGYNFRVEIKGVARNGFRQCHGLDANSPPAEYREGTDKAYTNRKLPGLVKYSNIVLIGGIVQDSSLWEWRQKTIEGKTERQSGSIILLDSTGQEKRRWNFTNGWPTVWDGPSLNATANEVAVETLEIAHEGIVQAK
jgi:phage tail-like protein